MGAADINGCEQTAEGLSKQMFDGEDFDTWSVSLCSCRSALQSADDAGRRHTRSTPLPTISRRLRSSHSWRRPRRSAASPSLETSSTLLPCQASPRRRSVGSSTTTLPSELSCGWCRRVSGRRGVLMGVGLPLSCSPICRLPSLPVEDSESE
jgi:hypothetical protein